jgi:mutual gliding-motility protein MglA
MGFINVAERTINAKLVYYGVGVGGKTTSLQQVHGILCPRNEVQLVSINTEQDSTLLFDFLPINLGHVGGFKIRIQGFTVPGQPKYKQMRKYVLQGADAVVFVVDSQRSRLQENVESLQSMREHLRTGSGTSEDVPIVVQYNKRDLPDILTEPELDRQFRFRSDIATFPSVATDGQGVFEAFVEATAELVERKVTQYGLGRGKVVAREVADGVRKKLWDLCDEARRSRTVVPRPSCRRPRCRCPSWRRRPKRSKRRRRLRWAKWWRRPRSRRLPHPMRPRSTPPSSRRPQRRWPRPRTARGWPCRSADRTVSPATRSTN